MSPQIEIDFKETLSHSLTLFVSSKFVCECEHAIAFELLIRNILTSLFFFFSEILFALSAVDTVADKADALLR